MKIVIEYAAQLKRAAGIASETVEVDPACTLQELLRRAAERHGQPLHSLLFAGNASLHPSILVFVGDNQVRWDGLLELRPGDTVTILSPVSGG